MKQPELGRKIAELRKAKGLTQEELVEKCNISVRTLQRIESGEVSPRSYTTRIIFAALDFKTSDTSEISGSRFLKAGFTVLKWLEQFYKYFTGLFNLKTNKMKKITILSIMFSAILFGLFALCTESKAQKAEKVIKVIKEAETSINKWINNGQIDSVLTLYRDDACVLPSSCGKKEMYAGLKPLVDNGYKVKEFSFLEISVGDSIAVEKYSSIYQYQGMEIKQKGMKEWRLTKGRWLIVNHIMTDYN